MMDHRRPRLPMQSGIEISSREGPIDIHQHTKKLAAHRVVQRYRDPAFQPSNEAGIKSIKRQSATYGSH
ncbi:MAG TPA: hypothetical protein VFQ06_04665 [Nitrospira sp.]|nr:hypothetical protein [Nitrospira sp.]